MRAGVRPKKKAFEVWMRDEGVPEDDPVVLRTVGENGSYAALKGRVDNKNAGCERNWS
jgi:hypothetical protein